jgi:hypothetical protein
MNREEREARQEVLEKTSCKVFPCFPQWRRFGRLSACCSRSSLAMQRLIFMWKKKTNREGHEARKGFSESTKGFFADINNLRALCGLRG